jgi:oligopeptide/dipeptide ABC transporter ATP-binding protein
VLEITGLTKRFSVRSGMLRHHEIVAVDRVSFSIGEGETVGLVGESGCGKSTIGRSILHLLRADGGSIRFAGQETSGLDEKGFRPLRRNIQMVFQNPLASFNPLFTIRQSLLDSIALRPGLSSRVREQRVVELLEMVQLPRDFAGKKPHELSGGQLQRVAVARALAPEPRFVFLDEPTSALDMSIRGQIVNLLLDLQEQLKVSYLFVTHDLRVVHFVARRMLVMYLGEIVETGTRDTIFHAPLHPYTHGLLAATLLGRNVREKVRNLHLSPLKGEVLQSGGVDGGCRLFTRCAYAQEDCRRPQELRELRPGHLVRCWRAAELGLQTATRFS